MNHLYENIAYLRGLAEGLELDDSKKGKMFMAIIDALDEMAAAINLVNDDIDDLDEYVDAIEEDLTDLEDDFYDEDLDDDLCEVVCPECGEILLVDDPLVCDPALGLTTINCPFCDSTIDIEETDCCMSIDDLMDFDMDLLDLDDDSDDDIDADHDHDQDLADHSTPETDYTANFNANYSTDFSTNYSANTEDTQVDDSQASSHYDWNNPNSNNTDPHGGY